MPLFAPKASCSLLGALGASVGLLGASWVSAGVCLEDPSCISQPSDLAQEISRKISHLSDLS